MLHNPISSGALDLVSRKQLLSWRDPQIAQRNLEIADIPTMHRTYHLHACTLYVTYSTYYKQAHGRSPLHQLRTGGWAYNTY